MKRKKIIKILEKLDQSLCERIIDPCGYDPFDEPRLNLISTVRQNSMDSEKDLKLVRKLIYKLVKNDE